MLVKYNLSSLELSIQEEFEIDPFILENLIITFIFIFDILKFKAFAKLSGLGYLLHRKYF